jgi:transcriptional regulator with XRE-family HTH domain
VSDVLEQRWRELGAFIRDQRRMGQLSLRKLADQAGVSNPYLSQIERGLRRPSAEILQQIAHALEISAETLYVRAGILDERDPDLVDVVSVIRHDSTLSDDQKQTLTHIYRSFQAANGTAASAADDTAASAADDTAASAADDTAASAADDTAASAAETDPGVPAEPVEPTGESSAPS